MHWHQVSFLTVSVVDTWASYSTLTYRSEVPTSISWSPDSSLFAVAMGAYVVLFDAVSASVRQSLTSPSCTKVQSVRFIGAGGCHLLAVGENMLVLWDLINMEGSTSYYLFFGNGLLIFDFSNSFLGT
jgi:WD40 repeat protein